MVLNHLYSGRIYLGSKLHVNGTRIRGYGEKQILKVRESEDYSTNGINVRLELWKQKLDLQTFIRSQYKLITLNVNFVIRVS